MSLFKPATREKTKARVLLAGPGGSGKTRIGLELARCLGERIAVVDSENRSASLYVGLNGITFDVCELSPPYTYGKYLQALAEIAKSNAYDVLMIDSLTHVWSGEGGALEVVDQLAGESGNKFTAFKDITPQHNRLLAAIANCPIHIICTVRTKTAYIMEERQNRHGKTVQVPVKRGLAPIFRDGLEYEFSVELNVDQEHTVKIGKTRITELDGAQFEANELSALGNVLREFHDTGALPKPISEFQAAAQIEERHRRVWGLYANSSVVNQPLTSIPDDKLDAYIERLEATVKGPATSKTPQAAANAARASRDAVPYLAAAREEKSERDKIKREMQAEAAGADPTTGEIGGETPPTAA